ncbi:MAG: HU family DNA-binding protein [Spirochaetota bacterium]
MTKHEIVDQLTRRSGMKRREVGYIVDNFLELILKNLDTDSRIEIRGFGTFTRVLRKERKVFSPIAGRSLDVPARSVLSFKPSKSTEREA